MHQQQLLQNEASLQKRPNTPMDFARQAELHQQQQQQSQQHSPQKTRQPTAGVKFQQIGDQPAQSTRFNEWDPYASNRSQQNERQKSPQKQKNQATGGGGAISGGGTQSSSTQPNTNFAFTFLNQDSSPRQASGRGNLAGGGGGGAGTIAASNLNTLIESNSAANLDLVVSGQKVGAPRRDTSPTNTPRESQQQGSNQQQQQQQQAVSGSGSAGRPFTRRLKPLDNAPNETLNLNSSGENQFVRQKTSV